MFHLEGESKNFEVSLEEIKNTFMGFKKISCFYFFYLVGLIPIVISILLTFYFSESNFFIGGIVFTFLRVVHLFNTKTYFVTVKLNNVISFDFSNNKKTQLLEKIKN